MPQTNRIHLDDDLLLPEVIEGNDESDWELWEDSVMQMDGQIEALGAPSFIADDDRDPFANVGKNRDL